MQIKIKRTHVDAVIPRYATADAGCFDLHACDIGKGETVIVFRNAPFTFRTGLAFEIPHGHAMLIFSRSGHGFSRDIRLSNCVGVIDADYRGEVKVRLTADGHHDLKVGDGDRIAQACIVPMPQIRLVEVAELSTTARGEGGFGSTGT